MMLKVILTLFTVTTAQAAWSETVASLLKKHEPEATFTTTSPVVPFTGYNLYYAVDTVKKHVTFAVEADTTGWIGFGIAEAAGMKGADIMIGHVDANGKTVVGDYHSVKASGMPNKDGCQDWSAHFGEEQNGKTLLVFSRAFVTGDSNDHEIISDSIKRVSFLCAHGANDDDGENGYSMHPAGKNVLQVLNLINGNSVTRATWTSQKINDPAIKHVDLRAAGSTDTGAVGKAAGGKMGPSIGGYPMPTTRTTYMEFCYPLSVNPSWDNNNFRTNNYMVAFEGVHGGTTTKSHIHHTVLYAYTGDDCSGTQEIIWVGGVTFFEDLPNDIGIAFSRYKSFMVQTHYDNPANTAGLKDDSGVRIFFSTVKPKHEAGTFQLGDGTLQLAGENGGTLTKIPVGRSFFTFSCPASGFSNNFPNGLDEINIFASILHMHQAGDMMYTSVIKAGGTTEKRVNAVQYFSFAHQNPTMNHVFKIQRGDSLKTRCYFNNPGTPNLVFGKGSEQEMCIDFLYYYPYNANIKGHCTFGSGGHFGGTYDGTTKITEASDNGFRAFGINVGTSDDPSCLGGATLEWTKPVPKTPGTAPSPTKNSNGDDGMSNESNTIKAASFSITMVVAIFTVLSTYIYSFE